MPGPKDDPKTLVSTDWLAAHLNDPDLRIIDASWHMPALNRDARAEYEAAHLPGAVFLDIDLVSDPSSSLPHMAPAPEDFAAAVGALGIGDGMQVVVYDDSAVRSAARGWWLFRLMGHDRVAVLDGGLAKWRAEGRALERGIPAPAPASFTARLRPELVTDAAAVAKTVQTGDHQIVDARGAARFRGDEPEPRPGLRAGHIPGARNLPFGDLFRPDGTMKPAAELSAAFADAGVDPARPVVTSCGSGVTAAVLSLGLERTGRQDWTLYDGSWTEWGSLPDTEIATGDA